MSIFIGQKLICQQTLNVPRSPASHPPTCHRPRQCLCPQWPRCRSGLEGSCTAVEWLSSYNRWPQRSSTLQSLCWAVAPLEASTPILSVSRNLEGKVGNLMHDVTCKWSVKCINDNATLVSPYLSSTCQWGCRLFAWGCVHSPQQVQPGAQSQRLWKQGCCTLGWPALWGTPHSSCTAGTR